MCKVFSVLGLEFRPKKEVAADVQICILKILERFPSFSAIIFALRIISTIILITTHFSEGGIESGSC